MRFSLPLLCMCAASALAETEMHLPEKMDMVKMDAMGKMDTMVKMDAMVKMDPMEKTDTVKMDTMVKMDPMEKINKMVKMDSIDRMGKMIELDTMDKMDKMVKMDTMVKVDVGNIVTELDMHAKPWQKAIEAVALTAEQVSDRLIHKPGIVKPEIAKALNMTAELEHWRAMGNPGFVVFSDDEGKDAVGIVAEGAPAAHHPTALLSSYIFFFPEEDVKFHFFNKYNEDDLYGYKVDKDNVGSLTKQDWDPKLPLKVIIHGYRNSVKSPVIQLLKNAFLKTGKYNVIAVDWGNLCGSLWYPTARGNVPTAGAKVAEFLDKLLEEKLTEESLIHIVGHSLGAHVAGITGKSMGSGVPFRITGLDPAGPLFELTGPDGHIHNSDAKTVDVIHTNAGSLGKTALLGDVDFYVDGGRHQKSCKDDLLGTCSHSKSYEYYTDSILNNKDLEGVYCSTLPKTSQECIHGKDLHHTYKAKMGLNLSFDKGGPYFVRGTPPKLTVLSVDKPTAVDSPPPTTA